MTEQQFPPGWDAKRVERLLAHYEGLTEEQQVAEDEEELAQRQGQTVITVPQELLPAIRQLLADHGTSAQP